VSGLRLAAPAGMLNASVVVPGSKSVANRAIICALLAEGESLISGIPGGDDTDVLLVAAEEMGKLFRVNDTTMAVRGSRVIRLPGIIDARLAGTSSRFLTALAALGETTCIIDGGEPLRARPMSDLHEALVFLGADVTPLGEVGHLPVSVSGGRFTASTVRIRGDVSSQFISALMLIGPMMPQGLRIEIQGELVSRSYVEMTARVMQSFGADVALSDSSIVIEASGYTSCSYVVEPDFSSAAFPLMSVVLREGSVTVPSLALSELQGDAEVLNILKDMGVKVSTTHTDVVVSRDAHTQLQAIDRDMSNCSDLVPAVAVACLGIPGSSRIRGVGFIRHKESDRLGDLAHELRKTGTNVEVLEDGLVIHGGSQCLGAIFETHHDHRLAMALSLLALVSQDVEIKDPSVVSKSWPQYFLDMNGILGPSTPGK
jgi:3-phosphoshikimate 1-carboxyvinyltransferase